MADRAAPGWLVRLNRRLARWAQSLARRNAAKAHRLRQARGE